MPATHYESKSEAFLAKKFVTLYLKEDTDDNNCDITVVHIIHCWYSLLDSRWMQTMRLKKWQMVCQSSHWNYVDTFFGQFFQHSMHFPLWRREDSEAGLGVQM